MTTPVPYTSITAAHWQPALGTPGEAVQGLRDIDQAIRIILTTPRGSDPHRPAFGSDLHLYIDWPTNRVVPHLVREAVDAIRQWEPRVTVQQVLTDIDTSSITLRVQWSVANGVLQQTEVPYARSSTA
ncbi:TPA: GPW/gp25 family protein [Pseudomonas aeruginosa]|uniref:GPW/gp25 family protein n=1 Tax=Pseudomonas aeruginosa TaxID=287 RepID=UPI000316477C|nr:GPW/gp25 family protein [Pseudomonas aeruginosa]AHA21469.1 baseplate protein [Pseudomonas aeruginosa PA1]AHA27268.1 putative phage baseplate protein [Pseudomonas aeruginosa PA1R]ALE48962.1 baseplate protein [Pseudomonas aeruginosa]EKF6769643.1 GPW/gp25 family protein [Pseudomonas aeruginosa]KPE40862.1 baseplate protein [Pseudomonas aeruginosa]